MEHCWAFWGLVLWLTAPYLDLTHALAPQQEWTYMVPQHCNWMCFPFGEHGCPSRTPNCSTCHHKAGGWNWIEAYYEKTMGYLRRTTALWWLVSGQHWALYITLLPSPSPSPNFWSKPHLLAAMCTSPLQPWPLVSPPEPHLLFVLLPEHQLSERAWKSVEGVTRSDLQAPPAPF